MVGAPAVLVLAVQALARRGVRAQVRDGVGTGGDAGADSDAGLEVDLDGRRATLDLGSLRRVIALAGPGQAEARADAWAALVLAHLRGEPPVGPVTARLLPRLLPGPDPRLWSEPVAGGPLHLALAEDLPGRVRLLTPFDLPRLGLSLREARRVALQNLLAATPPPSPDPEGSLGWAVGDGYDAARLLVAAAFVDAPLGALAVAPARDLCWLQPLHGRADVLAGIGMLRDAAALRGLPYALPPVLIWVHGDGHDVVEIEVDKGTTVVRLPPLLQDRLVPH